MYICALTATRCSDHRSPMRVVDYIAMYIYDVQSTCLFLQNRVLGSLYDIRYELFTHTPDTCILITRRYTNTVYCV